MCRAPRHFGIRLSFSASTFTRPIKDWRTKPSCWSLMFKNIKLMAVNSGRLSDCVTSIHLAQRRARRPRLRFSHYCCYSWAALIRLHWDVLTALLSGLLMTSYKYAHVSQSWAPTSSK